jgi:hypothetical protein
MSTRSAKTDLTPLYAVFLIIVVGFVVYKIFTAMTAHGW